MGTAEGVSEAACAVLEGTAEEVLLGELVAVCIPSVEGAVVLGLVIPAKVELLELELDILVGLGATRRILDFEVCTTRVAVIVLCVFGKAEAWPLHIVYASTTTSSVPGQHSILYFLG